MENTINLNVSFDIGVSDISFVTAELSFLEWESFLCSGGASVGEVWCGSY